MSTRKKALEVHLKYEPRTRQWAVELHKIGARVSIFGVEPVEHPAGAWWYRYEGEARLRPVPGTPGEQWITNELIE